MRSPGRERAFTLLEVMVAVLIISMLTISVFRFVKSVLLAVRISTDQTVLKQEMTGLINFLQVQLEDLPARPMGGTVIPQGAPVQILGPGGPTQGTVTLSQPGVLGALTGTSHNFGDKPADEMEWLCAAGHGVLTSAASGQYRVTLAIQNAKGKSGEYEIGLRRRTIDSDEKNYDWLPLMRPAVALEIRYFEPRGKQWIDAWKDPVLRPSLVRVRIWRSNTESPYEAVLALPAARLQPL